MHPLFIPDEEEEADPDMLTDDFDRNVINLTVYIVFIVAKHYREAGRLYGGRDSLSDTEVKERICQSQP